MEHEPIYLDGVDVSGCISFDKNNEYNICCYDDIREDKIPFANFCVENKNCYYKQFKRKEQECERLKEKLRDLELKNTTLQNRYQQLDGATRYLKALEEIEGIVKNFGSYAAWQEQRINKILDIINKAKEK